MALYWDVSKIPLDVRTVDEDGEKILSPVTHTLIWSTMSVGLHGITSRNVEEYAARIALYQKVHGALMVGTDADGNRTPVYVTREDVLAHVGLSCNVSDETRARWIARTITKARDVFPDPEPK